MAYKKREKTLDETRNFVEMVAKKQGWFLHPDKKFLQMLIEGLTTNYNTHGYYGCPCRLLDGDREKDKDIVCPCDYCVPDQKDFGHCYCGLYLTPNFHKSGKMPEGIPERRPIDKWL